MNYLYKTTVLTSITLAFLFCQMPVGLAQQIDREIDSFNKLIVSPRINVTLVKGDKEHVKLEAFGIDPEEVNVRVKGKTLRVYLDKARANEKRVKVRNHDNRGWKQKIGIYEGVVVEATITYRELKHLQFRGEQKMVCNDPLRADKFRIKLYGESKVVLASLKTQRLKASLFGENELLIKSGNTDEQILKLFGENELDTRKVTSAYAKTNTYGVSKVFVNTSELFKVSAFGESKIYYSGGAVLRTGLVLGENRINKIR